MTLSYFLTWMIGDFITVVVISRRNITRKYDVKVEANFIPCSLEGAGSLLGEYEHASFLSNMHKQIIHLVVCFIIWAFFKIDFRVRLLIVIVHFPFRIFVHQIQNRLLVEQNFAGKILQFLPFLANVNYVFLSFELIKTCIARSYHLLIINCEERKKTTTRIN